MQVSTSALRTTASEPRHDTMASLGIFTVKRVCFWRGAYYTYGGFGEYLAAIRPFFERTVLFARVFESIPPEGYYEIPHGGLEVVHLPAPTNEAPG